MFMYYVLLTNLVALREGQVVQDIRSLTITLYLRIEITPVIVEIHKPESSYWR